MRKKIIIGAPTANRGWVIRDWLNYIQGSFVDLRQDYDLSIALVAAEDDPSVNIVYDFTQAMKYKFLLSVIEENKQDDIRDWKPERYKRMVYLRNLLLEVIRNENPDYFLSLDTDILLHRDCIRNLLQTLDSHEEAAAVGGKTFMTPTGTSCPSFGMFYENQPSQGIRRQDTDGVFQVDIIMAIKLMTPNAYNVDYEYHNCGEDLGWSAACHDRGIKLWCDGRVANKHIMESNMLHKLDERCGF